MSRVSIEFNRSKKVVESEELLIKELAAIELRISYIKNEVCVGAATSQIRNNLSAVASKVNNERRSLKQMAQGLENINALYLTTENKLLGVDYSKSSNSKIFYGIIGAILVPEIAISYIVAEILGINTTKSNWITTWIQDGINKSNLPFFDLFGFEAKDKNEKVKASIDMIEELSESKLSDQSLRKKRANKLKEFNDAGKKTFVKGYRDENGAWHNVKDADKNSVEAKEFKDSSSLTKEATIASVGTEVTGALWDTSGEGAIGYLSGSYDVAAGKAEADASAYAGVYSYTEDGKKIFTPGIGAEIGVGVTAFSASAKGALGDEYFDVHGKLSADVGKVDAKASVNVGLFDKDGNLNPQVGAKLSAEALLAEASASAGVKLAGTDVDVKGSVNFGIGAHADMGLTDGKLSVDIGASLGVGIGVKLEIDFSGTVNAVADTVDSVWKDITGWFG